MSTQRPYRDHAAGGVPAEVVYGPAAELEEQLVHGGAAVVAIDLDGVITHWSVGAQRLYGWSGDEVIGRPVLDLMIAPDDQTTAEKNIESIRENGLWEGEFVVYRKGGEPVVAYIRSAIIKDDAGRQVGILGLSMDVSAPHAA